MLSRLSSFSLLSGPDLLIADISARDAASFGVLIVLIVFLALEVRVARREPQRWSLLRGSIRANLGLLLFNDLVLSLLSTTSLLLLAERHSGGLLSRVENSLAYALLAFGLLDLTLYFWHWANHRFDSLWMFHKVHHSDLSMNASTAFRLHFMEVLLTVLVKAVFILVTGVQTTVVLFNEAIMALFVVFHHTSLSVRGEKWLGRVIVTPSLHRVHHSMLRQEHDHNYGAVFSIWDRMFGTLAELEPARLGLRDVGPQDFLDLLTSGLTPFPVPRPSGLAAMIAEAAYYKAEKRGFAPGMEMLDWLDAEQEIIHRVGRRQA